MRSAVAKSRRADKVLPADLMPLRFCIGVLLLCALILAGCTSVRPTLKIGLLAPFEGLHRRSGYAALAAVRAAIADFPYPAAGVLPLALDDGGGAQGAQRAAQKLLADGRLGAVVGPLSPELAAAAEPLLAAAGVPSFAPHAFPGEQWAQGLVQAAGNLAVQDGAAGLVLAGWTPGWPQMDAAVWSQAAGLPVRLSDDPAAVRGEEAVFWLGSPEAGAAYLAQLRRVQPHALFVLGPAGEDPVFAERAAAGGLLDRVYWTAWTDAGYTPWATRYAASLPSASPSAYLVYRAALAALAAATGSVTPGVTPGVTPDAPPASWNVQVFRYTAVGDAAGDAAGDWTPVLP